jgi:hypothetical protein
LAGLLAGAWVVIAAIRSAVKTFLLPRPAPDRITAVVFVTLRRIFDFRLRGARTYYQRDQVMAYYGPVGLLVLLATWLLVVLAGYTLIFWAVGATTLGPEPWLTALTLSGSSLFTLGYAPVATLLEKLLSFSEAACGPVLIALLIGYMPTIYGAFSKREALVNLLEVRAGVPASATDLIIRFTRLHRPERIGEMWVQWEVWFSELEETHTSLAILNFLRSPLPDRHWVTAAGAVLDGASLVISAVDIPPNVQANLCIRAGYIALRRIADYFRIPYNPDPLPADPISVGRESFERALDILAAEGVPLKADRNQAWRDWSGWRVNYDAVLLGLARLTMAPAAPWSSPEMPEQRRPPLTGRGS